MLYRVDSSRIDSAMDGADRRGSAGHREARSEISAARQHNKREIASETKQQITYRERGKQNEWTTIFAQVAGGSPRAGAGIRCRRLCSRPRQGWSQYDACTRVAETGRSE